MKVMPNTGGSNGSNTGAAASSALSTPLLPPFVLILSLALVSIMPPNTPSYRR
jgi:hypothetical protein